MRRWGVAAAAALLAGAGVLGLTGCGAAGGAARGAVQDSAIEVASALGAEGQALAAMGFDTEELAAADPGASAEPDPSASPGAAAKKGKDGRVAAARERHQARVLLRRNTLHGEAVVQTKDGTRTVSVQRGTVTAIDGDSMTVKSTDGFSLTWTFDKDLRVVERRASVQPSEVKVGTQLGVAGTKDGDHALARLIAIAR